MGSHVIGILIPLLLLLSNFVWCMRKTLWNRERISDNFIFTDNFLWEISSKSRIDCARLCAEDSRCTSFTFTPITPNSVTCRGHSQPMTSGGSPLAGTKQYVKQIEAPTYYLGSSWLTKPCTEDSDCSLPNTTCFEQQCLCQLGYYYFVHQDACHINCTDLQDDFVMYPGWYVARNNINTSIVSWNKCREWCLSVAGCVSIEFTHSTSMCFIANITVLDELDFWKKSSTNISYFQRTCL